MADIEAVRKLLAEEYGICTDRDLYDAMRSIQKVNIGAIAAPIRKESERHEKDRCIA